MTLQVWQIIALTLLSFFLMVEQRSFQVLLGKALFAGILSGLIMGDLPTGLYIGGTLTLMSLGVTAIGGSSVPNYFVTTIIAVAIAVSTGQGMEAGLAIGLPVGMLGVQFDVLIKILNGFVARKSQEYCNKGEYNKMNSVLRLGVLLTGLSTAIPVFLSVTLGVEVVQAVLAAVPAWFTSGLSIAGKILPGMGVAILMRYMPVGKYFNYLLIGFAVAAFLGMSILGVSLLGFAFAFAYFNRSLKDMQLMSGGMDDE